MPAISPLRLKRGGPICRPALLGILMTIAAVTIALGSMGCQHTIDPFTDDLPATSEITTTSVEGARAAPQQGRTVPRREFAQTHVEPQGGTVDHWPLWWEDPFEDKGSQDGQFAWTEEDYLAIAYGPGRFLLNTMAFPISAWMTKPGTVMCSDGRISRQGLGYDHDAAPCPGGTAPPIDILEVGTYYEAEPVAADEAPTEAPTPVEE